MKHLNILKEECYLDMLDLVDYGNPKNQFTSPWRTFKIIVTLTLFPYLLLFGYCIVLYKFFFKYLFLLLDVLFFDLLFKYKRLRRIYKNIRRILYFFFYNPVFVFVPKVKAGIKSKFSEEAIVSYIVAPFGLCVRFLSKILEKVVAVIEYLINIEEHILRWREYFAGRKYRRVYEQYKKNEARKEQLKQEAVEKEKKAEEIKQRKLFIAKAIMQYGNFKQLSGSVDVFYGVGIFGILHLVK